MAQGHPVGADDAIDPKEQGFVAAGCPIGTPEFITAHVERVLGEVSTKLRGIITLRDTAQADREQSVQLLVRMVRYCVAPKPHHLFRTTPVQHTQSMASKVDTLVVDTVLNLLGVKNLPADVKARVVEQLHLAVSKGGFGLRSAAANAPVAYLASRADTAGIVARTVPATMEPADAVPAPAPAAVEGDEEEAELALRPFLSSAVTDVLAARSCIADSATAATRFPVEPAAHLERKISREQDEARAQRVLDAFATKRDKETFLSGATSDAGAWMDAAGTYASRTNMEDRDYKTAAQLRLQTIGFHGYCAECSNVSSGRLVPHDLHHSLTCRRLAGHRNKRHNVVRDTLAQLAAPIEGVEIVTEPVVHAGLGYARKEGCDTDEHGHDIDHRGDVWTGRRTRRAGGNYFLAGRRHCAPRACV